MAFRFFISMLYGIVIASSFFHHSAKAIEAGQYYYFISEKCEPRGPQTPEERGAVTPDVMLFEVVPAGISDYFVHMNTEALVHYTEEGQEYLTRLEEEQAYTAGGDNSHGSNSIHHDFMLQREAISLKDLIATLNSFSQQQTEKGYYYRTILALGDERARFKAVTRVRLTGSAATNRMLLSDYSTSYYLLDKAGNANATPFISVDHNALMRKNIHQYNSPFNAYTATHVCGEKWESGI